MDQLDATDEVSPEMAKTFALAQVSDILQRAGFFGFRTMAQSKLCTLVPWTSRYRHQEPPASRMRSVMSLLGMYNVATELLKELKILGTCFQKKQHCDDDSKRVGPTERMRRELIKRSSKRISSMVALQWCLDSCFFCFGFCCEEMVRQCRRKRREWAQYISSNNQRSRSLGWNSSMWDSFGTLSFRDSSGTSKTSESSADHWLDAWFGWLNVVAEDVTMLILWCCMKKESQSWGLKSVLEGPDDNFRAAA